MSLSLPPLLTGPVTALETEKFAETYARISALPSSVTEGKKVTTTVKSSSDVSVSSKKIGRPNVSAAFEVDYTCPLTASALKKEWWLSSGDKSKCVTGWTIAKWIVIVILIALFVVLLFYKLRNAYHPIASLTSRFLDSSIFALNPLVLPTYPSIIGLPVVIKSFSPLTDAERYNRTMTPRTFSARMLGYTMTSGSLSTHRNVDQASKLLAQPMLVAADQAPVFVTEALDAIVLQLLNTLTVSPSQLMNLSYNVRALEVSRVLPDIGETLKMSSFFPPLQQANASSTPTAFDAEKLGSAAYPVVLYPDATSVARSFVHVRDNLWRGVFANLDADVRQQQVNMSYAMVFNQMLRTSWLRPTPESQARHPDQEQFSSPQNGVVKISYNGNEFGDPASFLLYLATNGHQVETYVRTRTHDFMKLLVLPSEATEKLLQANELQSLSDKASVLEQLNRTGNYSEVPTAVMIRTGIRADKSNSTGTSTCLFPAIEASYIVDVRPTASVPKNLQVRFQLAMQPNLPFGGTGFWPAVSLDKEGAWVGERRQHRNQSVDAASSIYFAQTLCVLLNFADSRFRVSTDSLGAYNSALNTDLVCFLEQILFNSVNIYPCVASSKNFESHLTAVQKGGSLPEQEFFKTMLGQVKDAFGTMPDDSVEPVAVGSVARRILECTPYASANDQVFIVGKETDQEMRIIVAATQEPSNE